MLIQWLNHPAEGNRVMLNVRIATPPWDRTAAGLNLWTYHQVLPHLTFLLVNLEIKFFISGPYGEFHVHKTQREMMFIGGGAGMAPMRSHLFHQFHTLKTDRKTTFWYGARSQKERFYDHEFEEIEKNFPNFKYNVALSEPLQEDNWTGYKGFIHNVVLENYLKNHEAPEDIEYYLCGPPMMLNAIKKMLDNIGVDKDMIRFDEF